MATKTYAELQLEIQALEARAAKLKSAETAEVIAKIKEAVAAYELTPRDLFGNKASAAGKKVKGAKASVAKYSDGKGGVWVGRGKRPSWLNDALKAGKKLEDFAIGAVQSAIDAVTPAPAKAAPAKRGPNAGKAAKGAKTAKKSAGSAKYSDGAGKTWSGMGRKPQWFIDAIAGGKKPEDLLRK